MHWFTRHWYVYLFGFKDQGNLTLGEKMTKIICRLKDHPAGPFYYSSGYEPDMRCRNCFDELQKF